jgi:hypothetical protein
MATATAAGRRTSTEGFATVGFANVEVVAGPAIRWAKLRESTPSGRTRIRIRGKDGRDISYGYGGSINLGLGFGQSLLSGVAC